jgi:hypothetical protein
LKVSPKPQIDINAAPFHSNFRTFLSPKVAAFCRRTISFSWGWRHLPGVPDPSWGVATPEAGFGVEGNDGVAIEVDKREQGKQGKGAREEEKSCTAGGRQSLGLEQRGWGTHFLSKLDLHLPR